MLANLANCLIHQANYLLDQLIRRLEKDFVEKGGLRERMTRARLHHRKAGRKPRHEHRRRAPTPPSTPRPIIRPPARGATMDRAGLEIVEKGHRPQRLGGGDTSFGSLFVDCEPLGTSTLQPALFVNFSHSRATGFAPAGSCKSRS